MNRDVRHYRISDLAIEVVDSSIQPPRVIHRISTYKLEQTASEDSPIQAFFLRQQNLGGYRPVEGFGPMLQIGPGVKPRFLCPSQ